MQTSCPAPSLNDVDPAFLSIYYDAKHGNNYAPESTCPTSTSQLKPWSIVSSRNIGLYSMIKGSSFQSEIILVPLTLAQRILLPSRKFTTVLKRCQSCVNASLPLKKLVKYDKFMAENGYSRLSLRLNPIRSTLATWKILFGIFVSITSH
jgi:hypothetical protein